MSDADGGAPAGLSRQHGYGCLGLAFFAFCGSVLCVIFGVRCLGGSDLFACIGLLTVFPAAFAAVGLACAAVGVRRFTSAAVAVPAARNQVSFGPGRLATGAPDQPERLHSRPNAVIHLPASGDAEQVGDSAGEDERP